MRASHTKAGGLAAKISVAEYGRQLPSATKDDVLRVAKKHLQPDLFSIVAVGIKERFDKPLDTFGPVNTIDITIPEPKPKAPAAGPKGS